MSCIHSVYLIRYRFTEPENRLTELSHVPLGSQEMAAVSENDDDVQITSVPDGKKEVGMCNNCRLI